MTFAPLPPNETERLQALRRYDILDTPPETAFDRITTLAARLFQMPIALVSLVDESRAWFKSCYGFDTQEISRDATICSFALLTDTVLVVPDTRQDTRFACQPFALSEPGIRFYAGAPLITHDGFNLGTLCLVDTQPREDLSIAQQSTLADLAAMVVDELELRLAARKVDALDQALLAVTRGISAATGEAFFVSLVQHLSQALGMDYAMIGELVASDDQIKTLARCDRGEILANIAYSLLHTPYHQVIQQQQICYCSQKVDTQFPLAFPLQQLGADSYIAAPILGSAGQVLGLLTVVDRKPLKHIQLAEALLSIFATRAAAELERKQAEAERAQLLLSAQAARAEAEAANASKDEFIAVLSHELRTPLNAMLGWSRLLLDRQQDEATTQRALETIERNARMQSQLIEDLMDVTRIVQGKIRLECSLLDPTAVIAAAINVVQPAAIAKGIQLEALLTACPGTVSADPARLQQVLWNLLSNAIKFTPEGGRVDIRLACSHSHIEMQVSDTGNGIEPELLPYVFDRFRQAEGTSNKTQTGLGLGLAIVHHLVALHGGTITAASAGKGQGATFTLTLPLSADAAPVPAADATTALIDQRQQQTEEPQPLAGITVLLVEDTPDARDFLVTMLELEGATVTAVVSAAAARQALAERFRRVDAIPTTVTQRLLLVSDLGLPGEDGYSLMCSIRAQSSQQGGNIPAIALTAYAAAEDQAKALAAGFQAHLTKPIDVSAFIATITHLMQNA